jgi:polyhydroxybutyrate depolymerase
MQIKTIEAVRKHNGCAEEGSSAGSGGTLYSSSQGAPVMTFIHAGGHVIPLGASKLIVSFLKDHPKGQ